MSNWLCKDATGKRQRCWVREQGLIRWLLLLVSALSVCGVRPAAAVPVRVTYTDGGSEGFNDPNLGGARRRAFEAAAATWGRLLAGTVPVDISASMDSLGGSTNLATLGQAGPNAFVAGWNGGTPPLPNTYYAAAAANQLARVDLTPGQAEISAQFNSDVDNGIVLGGVGFYYGLDGRVAGPDGVTGTNDDPIDFFSVVLHEFGHGLGFLSFINPGGSFDGGDLSIYDRYLADGATSNANLLINLPQSSRAAAIISDRLYFAGPNTRATGGANARLYAPAPYNDGSSVSHLDEATYSGVNELMTPFASSVAQTPGPIALAMLRDLGWSTGTTTTPTPTTVPTPTITPTPPPIVRPANDDFESAQPLSGLSGRVAGRNVNATKQSGELNHAGDPGGHSIWYRWTAPASGRALFSTAGSNFDTTLAVYRGDSLGALVLLSQGDDFSETDTSSRAAFTAQAGTTYFIAVDGFAGFTSDAAIGDVVLSWSLTPVVMPGPTNDNFARAQTLPSAAGRVAGTNVNASKEVGERLHANVSGGRSVWYRWRAPTTARWTFSTLGSTFDTLLGVYTGGAVNVLSIVGANDNASVVAGLTSSVSFNAIAGTTYFIAVDGKNGASGNLVLNWNPAPLNDLFANATPLAATGRLSGNSFAASVEVGEPRHAAVVGGSSVWYRWLAPNTGRATFATAASRFDTLLGVYTGAAVNALRLVAGNDNASAGVATSSVSFNAVAGTTYFIAVDGRGGASGALGLQWSFVLLAPPNDNFARAQAISGSAGNVLGTNLNATGEATEPAHGTVGAGRSVWYDWTSPGNGRGVFSTAASSFDTVMAVYSLDAAGVLQLVAVNDDASATLKISSLSFPVTAGKRYFVVVDSVNRNGALSGPLRLNWALRP